ncbi:hypothetical protein INT45_001398 [Circinella minor]|uniref:Helitron helicase-like domain-containing protein n=1 Tax=Circinella minor TaxID=1195481 RepID=A0A8H7RUD1_9FUNG|nr:hypothetical protein INT45_001398 [Circinella minor]
MSIPICPSCHQPGHSRRTHRDCLLNAARLSICAENEIIFINDQEQRNHSSNDSGSLQQQSSEPQCLSCGQFGHSQRTSRQCAANSAANPVNLEATVVTEPQVAPVVLGRVSSNHIPERHSLGLMDRQCSHCQAHMWILERVGSSSNRTPENFHSNIRAYNNALSFASLGASIDHTVANSRGGAYNFRIYGEVYHLIGSLLPNTDQDTPSFAQIYVHDPSMERQLEIRRNHTNASIDMEVLNTLQTLMHRICLFAQAFNNMATQLRDEDVSDVTLVIRAEGTPDQRRYNRPTGEEVGLLIVDCGHEGQSGDRDIVVQTRSNQMQRISVNHRFYDAMHYVLMFPQGSLNDHLLNNDNNEEQNDLHRFGKLFQQYITDMYAKVESERLNYIRSNQDKLRSDLYKSVADAVNLSDNDMANVGKRVILPSSFIGGPRHMQQLYQDAMSIVQCFGKPDIFVTMTTNPRWHEI